MEPLSLWFNRGNLWAFDLPQGAFQPFTYQRKPLISLDCQPKGPAPRLRLATLSAVHWCSCDFCFLSYENDVYSWEKKTKEHNEQPLQLHLWCERERDLRACVGLRACVCGVCLSVHLFVYLDNLRWPIGEKRKRDTGKSYNRLFVLSWPLGTLWQTGELSQSATAYKHASLDRPAGCPSTQKCKERKQR